MNISAHLSLFRMPFHVMDKLKDGLDNVTLMELHSNTSEDGAGLLFNFNGLNIYVSVFPPDGNSESLSEHQPHNSIQTHLIQLVGLACTFELIEDCEESWEVMSIITDAGRKAFRSAACAALPWHTLRTAHDLMVPPQISYRLVGDEKNRPVLVLANNEQEYATPRTLQPNYWANRLIPAEPDLPQYSSKDLLVMEKMGSPLPNFVEALVRSHAGLEEMFCRLLRHPADDPTISPLERDITVLNAVHRVRNMAPAIPIRIPRLLGYVTDPATGHIIGYVRENIRGRSLYNAAHTAPSWHPRQLQRWLAARVARRSKWMRQVRETVRQLHAMGLTWGDALVGSVRIDKETDDAWLVRFHVPTWSSDERVYTVEEDEARLRQLEETYFNFPAA